jgi:hypothetical protein
LRNIPVNKVEPTMNTDEEYYLGLYERHAEARAGRRNRRRISKISKRRIKRRRGALDAYFNLKTRRYQLWLRQNYLRLLAIAILLFFGGYEIVALRDPLYYVKIPGPVHQSTLANRVMPPPPPNVSSETTALEKKRGESKGGSLQSTTPMTLTSQSQNSEPSLKDETKVNNPNQDVAKDESTTRIASISKDEEKRPRQNNVRKAGSHTPTSSVKSLPGQKSLEYPNKQKTVAPPTVASKATLTEIISDEPADAEAPEAKSRIPKSPPKISPSTNAHRSALPRMQSGHSTRSKTGKALSSDPGTIPGANENFWKWFQDSKGAEGAGASSVECPEESTRLCQMFYKFIRKYKIRTIYDVSCAKNLQWMPVILSKIGNEIWGFKYHCGEYDNEKLASAKISLKEFDFVEFDKRMWWKDGFPADIQLAFAWDVLPHTAYGRVWSFFVNARKYDITYILVDNYPGLSNDPSPQRMHLNLRKHPFRFPAAKEVVQNVTEPNDTEKRQLLFYETIMLPENIG